MAGVAACGAYFQLLGASSFSRKIGQPLLNVLEKVNASGVFFAACSEVGSQLVSLRDHACSIQHACQDLHSATTSILHRYRRRFAHHQPCDSLRRLSTNMCSTYTWILGMIT